MVWPPRTMEVMECLGKSKAFAINVVGNELWQEVGEYFLTRKLEYNYISYFPPSPMEVYDCVN